MSTAVAQRQPASSATPVQALEIVCFKWKPRSDYRSVFGPETVNTLQRMLARHYAKPHRLTCITDDATGIDSSVRVLPLWHDYADVPSPHGGKNPSCYRRLKLFSPEAKDLIGPRFVSMDLDCVITGDVTPIFERQEDFVMWGDTNPKPGSHYNGSLILMTAGARQRVWESFDPLTSPRKSLKAGCWGSDQGWISYCLGGNERKFGKKDGVYSFRNDIQKKRDLPSDCRIVFFHGRHDPWTDYIQNQYPWVRQHWQ